MAVVYTAINLSSTPVRIDSPTATTHTGKRSLIANHPGGTVFLGGDNTVSTLSFAWTSGQLTADLEGSDQIWAMIASGGVTLQTLMSGI